MKKVFLALSFLFVMTKAFCVIDCNNLIAPQFYGIPSDGFAFNCAQNNGVGAVLMVTSANNGESSPVIIQTVFWGEGLNASRARESGVWSEWIYL